MTDDVARKAKGYVEATRNWNGGAGLIVPKRLGRKLKEMGIEDGYTVEQPLPEIGDSMNRKRPVLRSRRRQRKRPLCSTVLNDDGCFCPGCKRSWDRDETRPECPIDVN